ncbi:MAG: D-2-hydroxyacid dehydrogenase, partial [Oscillospiraceae bacterium]
MKIVVLDGFTAASTDLSYDFLKEYCDELKVYDRTDKDEIVERIADAQMVITNKVVLSADILSKCKNVKYIGILATGYNNIDIEYCKNNNIVVKIKIIAFV